MNDITPRDRREVEKWVVRMLDDPQRHRAGLARWLLEKPSRRAVYDQLIGSVEDAGQAMSASVLEEVADTAPKHRSPYRPAAAAAVLLLFVSGMAAYLWIPYVNREEAQSATAVTFATRLGEVREEKLADGTVLTLDTDTRVHLSLSDKDRVVQIERGRVRFSVASDDRPFTVRVADSQLVTAGGLFDVSYHNRVAVDLLSGNLDLRLPGWRENAVPSRLIRLNPGERLTFSAGQRALPSVMTTAPSDRQWTNGVKSFDDVTIADVIAEANSYSPVQIILADPAMGEREIFGDFRIRDADSVASAIATFLHARIDRSKPGRLLIVK